MRLIDSACYPICVTDVDAGTVTLGPLPPKVCDLVETLTKVEGEAYEAFLRRVV